MKRAPLRFFGRHIQQHLRRLPETLLHPDLPSTDSRFPDSQDLQEPAAPTLRRVPLGQIAGSADCYQDFGFSFLPRLGLLAARRSDTGPIRVYQVGEVYFVKDGHHRVSAAQAEGLEALEAEVIPLPLEQATAGSLKQLVLAGERLAFLNATRLAELRPEHAPIHFSVTGRYDVLLGHIRTHQYFRGVERGAAVPWPEAVASWHDGVYAPLVAEIERHRVLRRFPGRSQADLYLWIMDHRHHLREAFGVEVGAKLLIQHYVARYAPRPLSRLTARLRRAVSL